MYASGHSRVAAMKDDNVPIQVPDEVDTTSPPPAKDYTANTTKPFRLPSAVPGGPVTASKVRGPQDSKVRSSALAAPTIQSLQARVQRLKQAIKIKNEELNDGEGRNLEALVSKWRTAGREVAWLVWDTIKDLEPSAVAARALPTNGGWDETENPFLGQAKTSKPAGRGGTGGWGLQTGWGYGDDQGSGSTNSWGWDDKDKNALGEGDAEAQAEDKMDVSDDEQAAQPHTVGTMLRHMGIDPDTLGWDEDDGDFVDDA